MTWAALDALSARRPLHLGGSLWWAWRGSVWQWGGRTFGALGGAVSPDRREPSVRHYRWPEEEITEEDLDRLAVNSDAEFGGRLDVLFTHDAPAQVQGLTSGMGRIPWETKKAADQGAFHLEWAVNYTQPAYVIHGHWHQANQERISDRTEVIGLAEDGRPGHTALLCTQPTLVAAYT